VKNRSVFKMLVVAFAIGLAFFGMLSRADAQSECSQTVGTTYVDALDGGLYNFEMNEYDSSLQECVDISGLGFTVTTADFDNATDGEPAAYTAIYRGCHWGNCTSSNPFPIQESNIASATSSVSITQPSGSANDAAYDIWFNQTSTTSGQPNGTEVMIWLNHQGSIQPFGSEASSSTSINGVDYEIWTGNQSSWKVVSFVNVTPVTSVSNLNLLPFFAEAVTLGSLEPSWYLIDVEYGFEIWTGGDGLAMSGFSVSAAASSGGSSCTTAPSAPSGLSATTSSSSVINLAWTADTAPANCTISGYNVYGSTTSGFTPSSSNLLASGVTATSYSATGLSPSTTYHYVIEAADAAGTSAASAQASATTQAASSSSACTVDYTISPQNSSQFGATVTIVNGGSTTLSDWSLTWTFANGQTIASSWNGTVSQSGDNVTVSEQSGQTWENIPAGGSYSGFGFNGTWNGTTNAIPTSFALNGTACTIN
jgi:Glycosyl hydrolase family 12/Cellulose binding domain/Fibronectin type III domain